MTQYKKQVNNIKAEAFLKEFSLIFLIQKKNFTMKEWIEFKTTLQQETVQYSTKSGNKHQWGVFNIKNSLIPEVFSSVEKSRTPLLKTENTPTVNLQVLCQGPNFLLGCHDDICLNSLWRAVKSHSKCIFISCFYKNQLINHLDLEVLLTVNNSIYYDLLTQFNKTTDLLKVLHQSMALSPLVFFQYEILNCLSLRSLDQ